MQLRDLVQEWLQKAQDDLDSAEFLSGMNPYAVDHRYPGEPTVDEATLLTDLKNTRLLFETLTHHIEYLLQ